MATTHQGGLALLKDTRVQSLLPEGRNVICFSKNDSINAVFKGLTENKILSAPLYDPHRGHMHTCFVDMVDIVTFFLSKFKDKGLVEPSAVDKAIADFGNEKCSAIADLSGRNPFRPVEGMAPLLFALNMMVTWKVHRVPVVDSEGDLLTVLSQSHMVDFIYSHLSSFEALLTRATVDSLGMVCSPIITVNSGQKAIDAFKLMHDKKVSGVGVVDDSGRLVGNLSVSDLKLIDSNGGKFSRLYYPVSEFMKLGSEENPLVTSQPVFVGLYNTFAEVVGKLSSTRIHRVYVVDHALTPIGVITQHEVLKAVLSTLQK